jgi:hypothetical protein
MLGVCHADFYGTGNNAPWITSGAKEVTYYVSDGRVYVDGVNTGATSGATAGDVISIAFDADARSVAIRKNNTLLTTKTITASSAGYIFYVSSGGGSCTATLNYGARPFAYTAPSGYKALCSTNLPTPTILNGATAMDVKLYMGNGSTQTISGLGFSPDFVWLKKRNGATSHRLFDAVRGATKNLFSDSTAAESTDSTTLSAFDSSGFSLGTNGAVNALSDTFAAWCWDAGSSTVTNTAGTISSQVRANASAGFSVVTYTGTDAAGLVGHGLGVTPGMIIVKARSNTANNDWMVYHSGLANPPQDALLLNSTGGPYTNNVYPWNSSVTSSAFGVNPGSGVYGISSSGVGYVAYCWAPVSGYSAFGRYTGNGSADGPFVHTGFRPRWIMTKSSIGISSNWMILDTARDTYNLSSNELGANLNAIENDNIQFRGDTDIVSNGFKLRSLNTEVNASGCTYIYAAFAENPFSISRAR